MKFRKFERGKVLRDKLLEREAEDDGFNIYFGVVKNMGVGQGK